MSELSHRLAAWDRGPVATISREELKQKLDSGEPVKLIMALNSWAFDAKHIPGSLHFDTPEELYTAVDPDEEVVVYCSNVDCLASVALYWALIDRGYSRVRRYAGGLIDWERRRLAAGRDLCRLRVASKPLGGFRLDAIDP